MLPNLSILDDFDRQGNAIEYSDSEVESAGVPSNEDKDVPSNEDKDVPSNEDEDTGQSEGEEESSVEVYI